MSNDGIGVRPPTIRQIKIAQRIFEQNERRALFYRAAIELIALARRRATSLSVAEALAVLLQTWNSSFYRYRPFDREHLRNIETLVTTQAAALRKYETRRLVRLRPEDHAMVGRLFDEFDGILGPVGATKALHLLAPEFFPLWDRAIARRYRVSLQRRGTNAKRYLRFLTIAKAHVTAIYGSTGTRNGCLKAWDEYNYCRYTKGWM